MELKEYVILFRRWFWLLITGLILGLLAGYVLSRIQTPVYEASTKVLVTRSREQGIADILPISDQQLVLTYQHLLTTRPVMDEAGSRLGTNIDPENIRVGVIPNTQILEITIQDQNPETAAAIANSLVQILIEQNENLQSGRYAVYEENLSSQIEQVQAQIDGLQGQITQINQATVEEQLKTVSQQISDLQNEIANLEKEIATSPNSLAAADRAALAEKQTQIDQLRSLLYLYQQIETNLTFIGKPAAGGSGPDDPRVSSLQATLGLYQELYLDLLNNLEAVKLARVQNTPTVTLIEDASIPGEPVRPIPRSYMIIAGFVGLLIAAGTVLLIDYFDETLKSSRKTEEILGIPVMAEIADANHDAKTPSMESVHLDNPAWVNAFALLRFNLGSMAEQKSCRTILITSAAIGEGKTTVAINLAAAFAQSGSKVALVDADLRCPALHSQLGLSNESGLTDILSGTASLDTASADCSGVTIVTSGQGSLPSHVLLESDKLTRLLRDLQKDVDFIILDGPPLFMVDAQILASRVDGILLVVRQGNTIGHMARAMLDQLRLKKANVIGVVLNRMKHNESYYYYASFYPDRMSAAKSGQEQLAMSRRS